MEIGQYRKRPIDWKKYQVGCFRPHLFSLTGYGCGANILSLLTGIAPYKIRNTNTENPEHWTEQFVINFLRRRKFIVKPFTACDATNSESDDGYIKESLTDDHVLLTVQLLAKNKATWAVIHNKLWYHNFQIYSNSGLSMLNAPMLKAFVLFHNRWKTDATDIDGNWNT
jgi:hypothetical protein